MSVINAAQLTFSGEEIKSLSEAIMTAYYEKPNLSEVHTLVKGIKAKKQIAILGLLGLVGKTQTGCDPTGNAGTITMSEKSWDPAYIGDRFEQCFTDLLDTFFAWGMNNGVKKSDLTSTDFANFLEDRLGDAITEAVFRLAWFGDTAAANYNDSPAGVLKNGTDEAYFNSINGLFKQIFTIVTGDSTKKIAITKNAAATYALQKFDSTDTTNEVATNTFLQMIDEADSRLTASKDTIILATKSLVAQYKRERRKASGIELAYQRTESGFKFVEIDGIRIYEMEIWDRNIKAYYDNGTKYYLPHRAVLSTKSNIQIGTEEEANLSELNSFYDQKTKTYNVDFGFNLDAKIAEDYKIMSAY